jgi:SAM-dependent methyltransferase
MNRSIIDEQSGWGREDSVAFFESSRHGPGSLYLSERLVLPRIARDCTSVLDIGCAAGGFVSVFRHFNDRVRYTGVDAVHSLLRAGAAANPGADFVRNDGASLPFAAGTHDLVWSSGILHLNSAYEAIVRDAWRVAKRWLICDFRLAQDGQMHVGAFDVDFGSGRPTSPLPYIVIPRDRLLDFLASLQPTPGSIVIKGYAHPVSPQARDVPAEVIMAFVVVEKGGGGAAPRISVDIRSREAFAATLDTSLDT